MSKQYNKVIGIYGVPRSGTTWLGELINSSPDVTYKFQPFFSYAFRDRITENSTVEDIENAFVELKNMQDDFLNQKESRECGKLPLFNKNSSTNVLVYKEVRFIYLIEHLLRKCSEFVCVAIIRNPIDTLESWINAPKEYQASWNFEEEWLFAKQKNNNLVENFYGYNKWKEALKIFDYLKKEYPERVYIIQYENLVGNSLSELNSLYDFLGLQVKEQSIAFLQESTSRMVEDPYAVYRNSFLKRENKVSESIRERILADIKGDDVILKYYDFDESV